MLLSVREKLKLEYDLFKVYKYEFIFYFFTMFYYARIFSRRLAFYLYKPTDYILYDIGFEVVPELEDARIFSELCVAILHGLLALECIFTFYDNFTSCVNLIRRYLMLSSIGHIIRSFTFVVTLLPGPAKHCNPSSPNFHPVLAFKDIFWSSDSWDSVFYNCGDLIFSGHVLHMVIGVCCIIYYHRKYFNNNRMCWIIPLIPIQIFFILSSRQHYTVDCIVGLYTSVLLFLTFKHYIDDASIDVYILKRYPDLYTHRFF